MGELSFHDKANDSFCSLLVQIQCPFTSQNYNDRSPQVKAHTLVNANKGNPAGNTKVLWVSQTFLLWNDTRQLTLSHTYQHFNPFFESPNATKLFGIIINSDTVGSLREKPLHERQVPQFRFRLCYSLAGWKWASLFLSQSLNLANSKKSWIWMTPPVSSSSKNLRVGSH